MKKILSLLTIFVIIISMSNCENELDNTNNEDDLYLTVTYHSNGYPFGEPPVDNNKYKPPVIDNWSFSYSFIEKTEVLDFGTMENEDYSLIGWKMRREDYTEEKPSYYSFLGGSLKPGEEFEVAHNIVFDLEWVKKLY